MALKKLYREECKWREDEEGHVTSYWMTLKKRITENWKRKHKIALCGQLALEEATDLSYDNLRNFCNIHTMMKLSQNENSIELVITMTTFYWMKKT